MFSVNVIIRLVLSLCLCPKVITLSSFHCIIRIKLPNCFFVCFTFLHLQRTTVKVMTIVIKLNTSEWRNHMFICRLLNVTRRVERFHWTQIYVYKDGCPIMKGQPQSQEIFGDRWNPIPMPIPWAGWHQIPIIVSPSNLHWLMSIFWLPSRPGLEF